MKENEILVHFSKKSKEKLNDLGYKIMSEYHNINMGIIQVKNKLDPLVFGYGNHRIARLFYTETDQYKLKIINDKFDEANEFLLTNGFNIESDFLRDWVIVSYNGKSDLISLIESIEKSELFAAIEGVVPRNLLSE